MISDELIQKIKDENDIASVIEESGVRLKKSGKYLTGLCPFHKEKTPSFTVTPEKGIYKCFGCGEAGNVIVYVMKTKNLPFVEAVKYLGERANIEIDEGNKESKKKKEFKDKLLKINKDSARIFFNNLKTSKKAQDYFKNRELNIATIKKFGLGYAEDSWHSLMNNLRRKGYRLEDLIALGLVIKSEKSTYDRFRNRVIFPVFDYRGNVIGFGGRVLDDSKPKYLNSPESLIFKKGDNLYGLNFAIKSGLKKSIIIVEGYMDVITLHEHNITNVVASLGTALTVNQGKLLKKFVDTVIICYDADAAGKSATERGFKVLQDMGIKIKILRIPDGKDPDEFVKKNGRDKFIDLVEKSMSLNEYKLELIKEKYDLNESEDVRHFIEESLKEICIDLSSLERDEFIHNISEITKVREEFIIDTLRKMENFKGNYEKVNNSGYIGQNIHLEKSSLRIERILLKLSLKNIENYKLILQHNDEENLYSRETAPLFEKIKELYNSGKVDITKDIEAKCNDEGTLKTLIKVREEPIITDGYEDDKLIFDCIRRLKKFKLEEEIEFLNEEIKEKEKLGSVNETITLLKKMKEKQKQYKEL
ncbi:DNA primase [Clostridium bornimense]|uniref:DNA primase n=1 Tax=Clostridium bornimense TaxID=1216932 RepID=W6RWI4_9CLOT|nr:DNA primase [Clostridium bornimense]CDM68728.1 DNA primase [Clostridium bornimense]